MHGAQCVRAYLRIQHVVQQAIVTAAPPTRPSLPFGTQGVLSPDFGKQAAMAFVASPPTLQVRDVTSGRLLRNVALPQVPAAYTREPSWGWAPGGQHLTLLFGPLWHMPWGPLGYTAARSSQMVAGMVHVNLQTGAHVVNRLPMSGGPSMARACFWQDCDLILVLVEQGNETTVGISDSSGTLLRSITDFGSLTEAWLGPAGQAAALLDEDGVVWLLWDLLSGALTRVEGQQVMQLAWATPFSGQAALLLRGHDGEGYVACLRRQQQQQVARARIDDPVDGEFCKAVWGSRLAIVATSTQLHLYSLSGGTFA